MSKQFEIVFGESKAVVVAELLESEAPITCENFWEGIAEPVTQELHHGGETGPEMPPTRDGVMVYDIGIYWDRGQSKLAQGWIPGNLFARVRGDQIGILRQEAGRLLTEGTGSVTLRRMS